MTRHPRKVVLHLGFKISICGKGGQSFSMQFFTPLLLFIRRIRDCTFDPECNNSSALFIRRVCLLLLLLRGSSLLQLLITLAVKER